MGIQFQRASVTAVKARIAITGPAGAGKTLGALLLAAGLLPRAPGRPRVAVIDTERGRSRNHADDLLRDHGLAYDVAELDDHSAEAYRAAFDDGVAHVSPDGLLVIDSLSHEWGAVLEQVDAIAARTGNKFASWNGPSQEHRALINTLVRSPVHLIVTMRSEMDYALDGGKVQKLGLAPVQRKGTEYEWDVVFDVAANHQVALSKCNAASLARALRPVLAAEKTLTPAVGAAIRAWLSGPREAAPPDGTLALREADLPPRPPRPHVERREAGVHARPPVEPPKVAPEPAAPAPVAPPVSPAGPQETTTAPPVSDSTMGSVLADEEAFRAEVAALGADARAGEALVRRVSARALEAFTAGGDERAVAAKKRRSCWIAAGVSAERLDRWNQALLEQDAPTGREVRTFLWSVGLATAKEVRS